METASLAVTEPLAQVGKCVPPPEQGATAPSWLLTDLFGQQPTGVDEDRFVAAAAALTPHCSRVLPGLSLIPLPSAVTAVATGEARR